MSEYINKEDVMNTLDDLCNNVCAYSKKQRFAMCGSCPLGGAFDVIENIPSADVVERKRGKWTGNKRHQSCSECHMTYCVPDGQDGELDMTAYHFCPNCGARMVEDDEA